MLRSIWCCSNVTTLRHLNRVSHRCLLLQSQPMFAHHSIQLKHDSSFENRSRHFVSTQENNSNEDEAIFNRKVNETLHSLQDYFDEILDKQILIRDPDTTYNDGVLTIKLGSFGTYVINKQTPNQQIWLSSPVSGPKRYDFVAGDWIYKHDGVSLHQLLTEEIGRMFPDCQVNFDLCKVKY